MTGRPDSFAWRLAVDWREILNKSSYITPYRIPFLATKFHLDKSNESGESVKVREGCVKVNVKQKKSFQNPRYREDP